MGTSNDDITTASEKALASAQAAWAFPQVTSGGGGGGRASAEEPVAIILGDPSSLEESRLQRLISKYNIPVVKVPGLKVAAIKLYADGMTGTVIFESH